jgi:pimeloyl-ACP methyl ester carboxylesterase
MDMARRSKVEFPSGRGRCSAWSYPGTNGACVVLASGGGVPKEPGTDRFAARFQEAGFAALAFDFRHFGESEGTPRQVIRTRRQMQDLAAAVSFAATLTGVDPAKLVAWGFSLAGGHVLRLAARVPLAAAIAQTPFVDGFASAPNALRHETLGVVLRFPGIALWDAILGLIGRAHRVPLAGPRGSVAMLTTPDAQDWRRALDPDGRYADWDPVVAARSVLRVGWYRPGRAAPKVSCPLLVVVADDDQSVLAAPAERAADRAQNAELVRVTGGHYAPFLDAHEQVVTAELDFLSRHLRKGPGGTNERGPRRVAAAHEGELR